MNGSEPLLSASYASYGKTVRQCIIGFVASRWSNCGSGGLDHDGCDTPQPPSCWELPVNSVTRPTPVTCTAWLLRQGKPERRTNFKSKCQKVSPAVSTACLHTRQFKVFESGPAECWTDPRHPTSASCAVVSWYPPPGSLLLHAPASSLTTRPASQ